MNAAFTGAAKATANSQSAGSNASVGRRPLNKRKKINGRNCNVQKGREENKESDDDAS